jgi:putative endonuclease
MSDSDVTLSRRRAQRRGHISEYIAALVLLMKGYRIVALRHRTKLGEIDIIARKRDLAIFVEVKARRDEMGAIDAVSYAAQNVSAMPAISGFRASRITAACLSGMILWQ